MTKALKIKSVLKFSTILFSQDFSRVIIFKSFYDTTQFYVPNLFHESFLGIQTATTVAKPEREPKMKMTGVDSYLSLHDSDRAVF